MRPEQIWQTIDKDDDVDDDAGYDWSANSQWIAIVVVGVVDDRWTWRAPTFPNPAHAVE